MCVCCCRSVWDESGQRQHHRQYSTSVLRNHRIHSVSYIRPLFCAVVVFEMDRDVTVSYSVQKWHGIDPSIFINM